MGRRFSVVLPTRERADTLYWALRTVAAIDYDNLQILVSDNDSQDHTKSVVDELKDPRIHYVNTRRRLSMSHNWEFALSHVDGEWVTFIGDDDALLPDCIRKTNAIIDDTGVDAVRAIGASYSWPDRETESGARLVVPLTEGFEIRATDVWLRKLYYGQTSYAELPVLYNGGFIRKSVIDSARDPKGDFFRSCNPDVYSSVALSRVLDRYAYSFEPLHVSGRSRHSTGGTHSNPKAHREARAKFLAEENIPMHKDFPSTEGGGLPESIQAFVYEGHLQSVHLPEQVPLPSPASQLTTILRTSGRHFQLVQKWGERFAAHHGLSPEASRINVSVHIFNSLLRRFRGRINATLLSKVSTGSQSLGNVYAASCEATRQLSSLPQSQRLSRILQRIIVGKKRPVEFSMSDDRMAEVEQQNAA